MRKLGLGLKGGLRNALMQLIPFLDTASFPLVDLFFALVDFVASYLPAAFSFMMYITFCLFNYVM